MLPFLCPSLLSQVPILASLLELPFVASILQGFLPSLVLLIFLALAPYLLRALIQKAGLASMTEIDAQLIGMYFLFQLFAVFIFNFISGTALSQLQGLIDDPHRYVKVHWQGRGGRGGPGGGGRLGTIVYKPHGEGVSGRQGGQGRLRRVFIVAATILLHFATAMMCYAVAAKYERGYCSSCCCCVC